MSERDKGGNVECLVGHLADDLPEYTAGKVAGQITIPVVSFAQVRVGTEMKLGINVRNAISWFAHALIAGNLGPDDSRYSRDQLFLKHPGVVGQAMAIFLYRLEIGDDGRVLNHEEAEERVRQFIEWKEYGGEPEPPFGKEELGIN